MNSGQTLLVIAAFTLLSVLSLSINATIISTTSTGLEMEANLSALSFGESMLDEILTKYFDQAVSGGTRIFSPSLMTPTTGLGPDGYEAITVNGGVDTSTTGSFLSKTQFNDVDDYHNYHRQAWDPRLGWFTIVDTVRYLNEDNLYVVTGQTFHKEVTVTITNPSMIKDNNGNVIPMVLKDISVYRKYF